MLVVQAEQVINALRRKVQKRFYEHEVISKRSSCDKQPTAIYLQVANKRLPPTFAISGLQFMHHKANNYFLRGSASISGAIHLHG